MQGVESSENGAKYKKALLSRRLFRKLIKPERLAATVQSVTIGSTGAFGALRYILTVGLIGDHYQIKDKYIILYT
jgi:hypothetical protein